jgi:alpha-galactosidase
MHARGGRPLLGSLLAGLSLSLGGCGGGEETDAPPYVDPGPPELDEDAVPVTEGLAPTPPMGWSSWNAHQCGVTEDAVKAAADAMVSSGMVDAGYQYINIDDCWMAEDRLDDGTFDLDVDFPSGIPALADYVHERGLKLGLYSDRGSETCAGRMASRNNEVIDARTWAAWGVDYLKYDNCLTTTDIAEGEDTNEARQAGYQRMRDALDAEAPNMVFSICAWNFYEWGIPMGQLWRSTGDIKAVWDAALYDMPNEGSVMTIARSTPKLAPYNGPNGWNDPDMLEVGNLSGLYVEGENRAHMSLWALFSAPLIAGTNLATMDEQTREVLTNPEVIAVDQDGLGIQGVPVWRNENLMVWAKPLARSGDRAVVLLNATTKPAKLTANFTDIGLRRGDATVRDLWAHADLGTFRDRFSTTVGPHDVSMVIVSGSEPTKPKGGVYLSDHPTTYAANGLGPFERNTTNGGTAARDGKPLRIGGRSFSKGLGIAAPSALIYRLGPDCTTFRATIGVDEDQAADGSLVFEVWSDNERLYQSDAKTGADEGEEIEVDVTGRSRIKLRVTNAGDGDAHDRGAWADARVECAE